MTETASPVIELRNVVKSYGSSEVLRGFSISLLPGQIVGLIGPNGVGKTTAMRVLMGQILPDEGEVLWHGEPMTRTLVKKVGYLPEERDLKQKMAVRSQLEFASRLNGASWEHASDYVDQVLHRLELTERAESSLDTLNLGAQQRVQLAAALVHNPQALILDEPDSGLDGESADLMRTVLTEIASRGVPVLISSHRIQFVEDTCTHLAVMIDGAVRAVGPIDEILNSGPRQFRITADQIVPGWTASVRGATELESIPGYTKVELAPGVDDQLLLAVALEYGPLSEFTPIDPGLDELYGYIAEVTGDGRVLGSGFVDAPLPLVPEPREFAPIQPELEPIQPEPIQPEPELEPIQREPLRAEPIRPDPLTVEPIRPDPLTVEPIRPDPLTVEPIRPDPLTVEPIQRELLRAESLPPPSPSAEPLQHDPIQRIPTVPERVDETPFEAAEFEATEFESATFEAAPYLPSIGEAAPAPAGDDALRYGAGDELDGLEMSEPYVPESTSYTPEPEWQPMPPRASAPAWPSEPMSAPEPTLSSEPMASMDPGWPSEPATDREAQWPFMPAVTPDPMWPSEPTIAREPAWAPEQQWAPEIAERVADYVPEDVHAVAEAAPYDEGPESTSFEPVFPSTPSFPEPRRIEPEAADPLAGFEGTVGLNPEAAISAQFPPLAPAPQRVSLAEPQAIRIPTAPDPIRSSIGHGNQPIAPLASDSYSDPLAPPTRVSSIGSREVDPETVAQRFTPQPFTPPAPVTPEQLQPLPPPTPALPPSEQSSGLAGGDHQSRVPSPPWETETPAADATTADTAPSGSWWSRLRGRPNNEA